MAVLVIVTGILTGLMSAAAVGAAGGWLLAALAYVIGGSTGVGAIVGFVSMVPAASAGASRMGGRRDKVVFRKQSRRASRDT